MHKSLGFMNSLIRLQRNCILQHRSISMSSVSYDKLKCQALVVGGGTGGCTMAAKLSRYLGVYNCIVVDPADKHFYQPMFTLIGGGILDISESYRNMNDVLPEKANWIKDSVVKFNPDENSVTTADGHEITYDVLIIAVGLQLNYDKIPGLKEALSVQNGNVTSIYSPLYVRRHYEALKNFKGGNLVFTYPASPVKCPGAPQKICYLSEHYLRKNNKRDVAKVMYNTSLPVIFGVKYYADALWKLVKERNIEVNLKTELVEVIGDKNIAVFANVDDPSVRTEVEYAILHAVPPQSVPPVLKNSPELVNAAGFVEVNKDTLQHIKYPNVFAIGDCTATPNSKTMAAAAGQAGVLQKNISSFLKGQPLTAHYDGYASCPLVTGYNSCIMAEFNYDLQPLETFPFRQNVERYSMYIVKRDILPDLYWLLMLKGFWNGPAKYRKFFSLFKF